MLTEDLLLRLTPDEVRQLESALEEDAEVVPQIADLFASHTSKQVAT